MQQMPGRSADIAQSAVSARDALLLQGCRARRPEVTVALTAGPAAGSVRPPSRHSCLLECPAAFACGALRQQHLGIARRAPASVFAIILLRTPLARQYIFF